MNILVIGGTGLVGSYLLPNLIEVNHKVTVLTRSESKLEKISRIGAIGLIGDIRKPELFINSLSRIDMIILLAMPSVKPGHRLSKQGKELLRAETNDFFRNSLELAKKFDIPIIIPSGTSFKTVGDEIANETWPIRRVGLTEIGKDSDIMFDLAVKNNNPKVIQLLYGKIYGNGGLFSFMFNMMKNGKSKVIGDGNNYIPNIHAFDVATAIVKAVEVLPIGERIIIADDTPVTQKDFTYYMAEIMNVKKPGKIPDFIIKLVLGNDMFEVIKMNCKVSNQKAKRILGWELKYPSYKEGLEAVISEMYDNPPYFS